MSIAVPETRMPVDRLFWWGALAVAVACLFFGGLFLTGLLTGDTAVVVSNSIYPFLSVGAGIALVAASLRYLTDRSRTAWLLVGLGVASWGAGETTWAVYELILEVEVPYPGLADVFYVVGYPLIFIGILLMPHVQTVRFERLRITLDTLAGSVSLLGVLWVLYLRDFIYWEEGGGFLYNVINNGYAVGDVFLLLAAMLIVTRRSEYQFDPRLLLLAIGLAITAFADIIYATEAAVYVGGGWLDAIWLFSYGSFAVAGWILRRPLKPVEHVKRKTAWWQLLAPYAAIVAMFALAFRETLAAEGANSNVLGIISGVVGFLILARQWVAIRENRELVEKERNDLVGSISHELRTPLTAVSGFTQLLAHDWEALGESERREMILIVDAQAQHLTRIVTDLVDVARDRLHSTAISAESISVDELIDASVVMVSSLGESVSVEVDIDDGMEVYADRERFQQVLVNLLSNAERYGKSQVAIVGRRNAYGSVVEIHDNGPGVAKRYEQAIWDRFERGAHRYDATTPGSGIGLSIVKSLVEAHGGRISYRRSEELGGACFSVELPHGKVAAHS